MTLACGQTWQVHTIMLVSSFRYISLIPNSQRVPEQLQLVPARPRLQRRDGVEVLALRRSSTTGAVLCRRSNHHHRRAREFHRFWGSHWQQNRWLAYYETLQPYRVGWQDIAA